MLDKNVKVYLVIFTLYNITICNNIITMSYIYIKRRAVERTMDFSRKGS